MAERRNPAGPMRPPRSCHQQEGGERMDGRAAAVGLKQRHLAVTGSKREAGERRREAVRTPRGLPPHRPLAELKAAAPSALPAATAPTAADLGREALLVPASEIPAVEDAAPTVARDGLSHSRPAPPLERRRVMRSGPCYYSASSAACPAPHVEVEQRASGGGGGWRRGGSRRGRRKSPGRGG